MNAGNGVGYFPSVSLYKDSPQKSEWAVKRRWDTEKLVWTADYVHRPGNAEIALFFGSK